MKTLKSVITNEARFGQLLKRLTGKLFLLGLFGWVSCGAQEKPATLITRVWDADSLRYTQHQYLDAHQNIRFESISKGKLGAFQNVSHLPAGLPFPSVAIDTTFTYEGKYYPDLISSPEFPENSISFSQDQTLAFFTRGSTPDAWKDQRGYLCQLD